ncbi:MAG: hypothetical protein II080_09415, partial [Lachnospiraceae bacterium]|nr:hypothetical protein [Lachnospiraceae bacterium]
MKGSFYYKKRTGHRVAAFVLSAITAFGLLGAVDSGVSGPVQEAREVIAPVTSAGATSIKTLQRRKRKRQTEVA